jgi:hypothetical protein
MSDESGGVDAEQEHATHRHRAAAHGHHPERHPVFDGRPVVVDQHLRDLVVQVGEIGEKPRQRGAVVRSSAPAVAALGRVFIDEVFGDAGGDAIRIMGVERVKVCRDCGPDRLVGPAQESVPQSLRTVTKTF